MQTSSLQSAGGCAAPAPFSIPVRVYYEDTDAGGIVYHANYLKFCERARTDFIRACGVSQKEWLQQGLGFVIASMQAKFRQSAHLDDLLTVTCEPVKLRKVAITFKQRVFNEAGELLFVMECDIAYLNTRTHQLLPLPSECKEAVGRYMNVPEQED